jgi:hypothetical protein
MSAQPNIIFCPCCGQAAIDGANYIAPTNEQTRFFVREHPEKVADTLERLNDQIRELQRELHAARVGR